MTLGFTSICTTHGGGALDTPAPPLTASACIRRRASKQSLNVAAPTPSLILHCCSSSEACSSAVMFRALLERFREAGPLGRSAGRPAIRPLISFSTPRNEWPKFVEDMRTPPTTFPARSSSATSSSTALRITGNWYAPQHRDALHRTEPATSSRYQRIAPKTPFPATMLSGPLALSPSPPPRPLSVLCALRYASIGRWWSLQRTPPSCAGTLCNSTAGA